MLKWYLLQRFTWEAKHNIYILFVKKNIFALTVKQATKTYQSLAFLPVSKARTNKYYVFRHFTCISTCLDKDSINTKKKQ